jgi:hypothetical protein
MSRENLKPNIFSLNDLTTRQQKAKTFSRVLEKAIFPHSLPAKGD